MVKAYMAIDTICNENCKFCPCNEKSSNDTLSFDDIIKSISEFKSIGINDVTISGGEPTIHNRFVDIISMLQSENISVTVLSNGEMFSNDEFFKKFVQNVERQKIKIITTLHSSLASMHERANRTPGSFNRTILGLKKLRKAGVRVIIKHCITKENYKYLLSFYKFCDELFDNEVDIQLCSIDYSGMDRDDLHSSILTFPEIRPYLEELFDFHLSGDSVSKRKLYCINMPLCSADPYYWKKYLPFGKKISYKVYADSHHNVTAASENAGIDNVACRDCKVREICSGTYFSAYGINNINMVKPFL